MPVQMAGGAGAGTGGGDDAAPITNSTTGAAAAKGNKRPLARRYFAKRADLENDSVDDIEQWQH